MIDLPRDDHILMHPGMYAHLKYLLYPNLWALHVTAAKAGLSVNGVDPRFFPMKKPSQY